MTTPPDSFAIAAGPGRFDPSLTSFPRAVTRRPAKTAVPAEAERHVYFVQAENGLIKIGVSNDPRARLRSLQTGSPVDLTLLGAAPGRGREMEAELHERFAAHRVRGEWFQPAPELIAYICRALQQQCCGCGADDKRDGA